MKSGDRTKYIGDDKGLQGYEVVLLSVFPGGARDDWDPDETELYSLTEYAELGREVQADDVIEVQPIIKRGRRAGQQSFVRCDVDATDLACFAHLGKN